MASQTLQASIGSLNLHKPHLISIHPNASISSVLDVLKKHNIISIPILSHSKDEYMGIISVFDICCYILRTGNFDHHIESAFSLNSGDESFLLQEVDTHDSIKEVMQTLCKSHRVLVTNKQLHYMISQTDIVNYLYTNNVNPELQSKSLNQVLQKHDMVYLTTDITAKKGFELLKSKNHLALPIVDQNKAFVHVLSSSDLRGMNKSTFKMLDLTIIEFLKAINKPIAQTCLLSTTLKEVMKSSIENMAHRTFIVDSSQVINVMSLTDIIKLFLQ